MNLVCAKVVDAWEGRRSKSAAISRVGCGAPSPGFGDEVSCNEVSCTEVALGLGNVGGWECGGVRRRALANSAQQRDGLDGKDCWMWNDRRRNKQDGESYCYQRGEF
jgi:hypothetical protein